jgi:hypothetical protein
MELEQLILGGHERWVGVAFTLMCDTIWCKFALYWGKGTWKCLPSGTGKAASFAPKKTVTTSGGEDNWFPHPPLNPNRKASACLKINTRSRETSAHFFPISPHELHKFLQIQWITTPDPPEAIKTFKLYLLPHLSYAQTPKKTSRIIHQNENHLHPSSLESLTSGKILSRIKRAQEVLYPR